MWVIANFNGSGSHFIWQFLSHQFALDRVVDVFWNVRHARHEALFAICNAINDDNLKTTD